MNTRALAAKIVTEVFVQGKSLTDTLAGQQSQLSNAKDSALLQELCFGVCRWWWRYDAILKQLLDRPLKQKDIDLKHLAMVGLYQLMYLRVPDHAAVAETVNACNDLNKPWASKLINALLRNYQRKSDSIEQSLVDNASYRFSHPAWLLEAFKKAWPDYWQEIVEANNQKPPMVLRVNSKKTSREDYQKVLADHNIVAAPFSHSSAGLILDKPLVVDQLPGFEDGSVSVQDGAAQLAAELLQLDGAKRVLDVCAAPGGKTAHILEQASTLEQLIALDVDAERLSKVDENLRRLGLNATSIAGDARQPEQWWDGQLFDRVLLDAPCSATGVIRRHPDIKRLRRAADIEHLVNLQADILAAVWPLLGSGGMLLYATCSILPDENDQQIDRFIQAHDDAKAVSLLQDWGVALKHGRQIIPGQDGMDGFYYACLQKY